MFITSPMGVRAAVANTARVTYLNGVQYATTTRIWFGPSVTMRAAVTYVTPDTAAPDSGAKLASVTEWPSVS